MEKKAERITAVLVAQPLYLLNLKCDHQNVFYKVLILLILQNINFEKIIGLS